MITTTQTTTTDTPDTLQKPSRSAGTRRKRWKISGATVGFISGAFWLIFLSLLIEPIVALPVAPRAWMAGLLIAFAVLYLRMITRYAPYLQDPGERRRAAIDYALMCAIALASLPSLGTNALVYSPFLATTAVYSLWIPVNLWVAGGSVIATYGIGWCYGLQPWQTPGLWSIAIVIIGHLYTQAEVNRLESAEQWHETALLDERNRIATDVHDLLGHSLTVVGLKMQLIDKVMDSDPARAHAELAESRAIVADALANVRQTVSLQRSRSLAEELTKAREALMCEGIAVNLDGDPDQVTGPIAFVLAWVVRESTTNILRHAHAANAWIEVGEHRLRVEDDGDGLHGPEGNGILGMKERVAAAGGALEVMASPLGGTRVEVTW